MFEAKQTMDTIIPAFNHSLVRFSYTDTKPAVHMVTETATRLGWLVRQDGRHVEPITVEPEPIGSDEAWAIVTRAVSSLSRVLAAGRTHKIGASRFSPDGSNGSQRRLLNVMLMLHYTQLLRAAVTAALMLAVMRAALAGPLEDADAAYGKNDYATAFRLFRLLADQGDATAQTRLGQMYEAGQSVPEDYAEAVAWYRRAANQGFKIAQWLLGTMYQTGYGVPQDYVQALMWYNLSATQGWKAAEFSRASLERAVTRAQVAEAQKLARDWKPKSER
jgi:Sel1 repeat